MTTTTISLDGVSSETAVPELIIADVTRQITPAIRDSYREVPGRSGSWLLEESGGDRSTVVEFAAVGDTPALRRAALRAAGAYLYGDGLGRRKLIVSDEPTLFYWAKLSDQIQAAELLNRGRFSASFRTSPFALSTSISTSSLGGSGSVVIGADAGLASFFEPSIEVTAGTALGGGFTLTIGTRTITYAGAIGAAGKVTISTISSTVTTGADADTDLDGYFDPTALAMTNVSGDFPTLTAGTNTVTFTPLSGGTATLDLRWRLRYV